MFARRAERLPAGGEDAQAGRHRQQSGHQPGALVDQVLAVVQEQQQLLVGQVVGEHGFGVARGHLAQAQRPGDRGAEHRGGLDPGQLDQPRPVAEAPLRALATRNASRDLPTPPTPVNVVSRDDDSMALTSVISRRRPTKLVASAGRPPDLPRSDGSTAQLYDRPGPRA
ncbi:hypothetical protein ACFQ0O_23520 [Saccharopolyspora spinosporotrichia]